MFNQQPVTFWNQLPTLEKPRPASTPKSEYDPVEAEREAQEILRRAREDAEATVTAARKSAEQVIKDANAQAEFIKALAKENGAKDGFEQAKDDVRNELSTEWDAKVDALKADIDGLIEAICAQRTALWEQTEQEVLAFVIEMAKRVVKVEITQNKKVIGEMIRHALRRVADKENVRIRVSPDELTAIRSDRKDLMLVLDGARQLEIVDDRRIGRGGCVVETNAGTIDARIEVQFEQIADKLGVTPLGSEATE